MKITLTYVLTMLGFFSSIEAHSFSHASNQDFIENVYIKETTLAEKNKKPTQKLFILNSANDNVLLEIKKNDLPVTATDCLYLDYIICGSKFDDHNQGLQCVSSCFSDTAEILGYNPKKKILYFAIPSPSGGTAGIINFIFLATLNDKNIKLVDQQLSPSTGTFSPSGTYFLLPNFNSITIYISKTGKNTKIVEENIWDTGKEKLHYLNNIKWLSDTKFTYTDGVSHSKFQQSYDEMKENTYDIDKKKILNSRVMAKTEYDSTPYED